MPVEKTMRKEAFIIYDSRCILCRLFSAGLGVVSRVLSRKINAFSLQATPSRKFLIKQFRSRQIPFSLYFIDGRKIYWGKNAAFRIGEYLGFPVMISRIFYLLYPSISKFAGMTRLYRCMDCNITQSGEMNLR